MTPRDRNDNSGRRSEERRAAPPQRQRGVALIIALILVALAAILATKLTFDGWIEQKRAIGVIAAEQAVQFGSGAEALAADVLAQNQQGATAQTTLAQPWAQSTQPLPLTPNDDPEGEPIGTLQASLQDQQGLFNLNDLAALGADSKTPDPIPFEIFQRLLVAAGLDAKWAGMARDWIDADDQPGSPDGAEDAVYTSQTPPYRTANWPMTSPRDLMNLPGFTADMYRKIAPYVTALPAWNSHINTCTAPALVLESLAPSLSGEFTDSALTTGRKTGCFPDKATLTSVAGGAANYAKFGTYVAENSSYFRLTTRVTLGTTEFTLYSLLLVGQGGKVTPLLRTFGTF